MHWINHYPLGKSIHFDGNYAVDGDLYPVKVNRGEWLNPSFYLFVHFFQP